MVFNNIDQINLFLNFTIQIGLTRLKLIIYYEGIEPTYHRINSTNKDKYKDPRGNKRQFYYRYQQQPSNKTMSFCRHSTPNSSPVISWIQSRRRLVSKHSRSQSVAIRAVAWISTMANSVRVAVVQMTSVNDIAANFATCSRLVKVPFDFRLFRCYMFFMPVFGW